MYIYLSPDTWLVVFTIHLLMQGSDLLPVRVWGSLTHTKAEPLGKACGSWAFLASDPGTSVVEGQTQTTSSYGTGRGASVDQTKGLEALDKHGSFI